MNLTKALELVSQGFKVSCPGWLIGKAPSFMFKNKAGYLAWYSGDLDRIEPIGGSYLSLWINQNADDWEVLP